ncbi:leucyl aminopeptidase [Boudabousia marimammalium]|uniref:Probable cytosol aminopeptidase n=1 Tax=Boudabousia marimammalium TaxID=156892 RepID=A0A1Q5PRI9_9ACTO|nr:leucyl aminopeptidase [Boudabousia marimammalium]OKL50055.1 leucyl aminopeptidase [Boudabousia marimammalium]
MTNFSLFTDDISTLNVKTIVLAVAKQGEEAAICQSSLDSQIIAELDTHLPALGMDGSAGSVVTTIAPAGISAETLTLVGVGKLDELDAEAFRRAAGVATRITKAESVAFDIATSDTEFAALVEGAALGAYRYDRYLSKKATRIESVSFAEEEGRQSQLDAVLKVSAAVSLTRDLVNTPSLDLYPEKFVELAREAIADLPIEIEVWDMERLRAEGCGGIVGVGQGSSRPPFMVRLSYSPNAATSHIALIGKGITFDSGGISLKPGLNMENMKSDMAGAATVLSATVAAAQLGLDTKVTTYLALAENLPSDTAQRPSDVVKIRNGKTVEVINTDAEGRMVMADALSLATELNPDAIIDVATLTGAQIIALGNRTAGLMGQGEVPDELAVSAQETGEPMWVMPIPEETAEANSSTVADVQNTGGRPAGMLVAANFLSNFVADFPWAHMDIAGPSYNTGAPWGFTPKGGTGMGVRTLIDYLISRQPA